MRIKIMEPLGFIARPKLTEFDVTLVNGAYVLTTEKPRFKQLLKKSEYEKILAARVKQSAGPSPEARDSVNNKEPLTSGRTGPERTRGRRVS